MLDANVLLALAWPNHQFHQRARTRMAVNERWATCAITELAFLRLYITPAIVGVPKPADEALATLGVMLAGGRHQYWADLPPVADAGREGAFAQVMGHRQVNDAYLLELARRHGGRLLTFDRRLEALGAPGVAEVLAP